MPKNVPQELNNVPQELNPIGVFDSGIGGLTVLKQLRKFLPDESFIYLGDTARLPYGDKTRETVVRYSVENGIFLLQKDVKMLVVACNTASSFALERLQEMFNIPVIGVIDAGAQRAVEISKHRRIAILGTRGTIQSQSFQHAILQRARDAFILPIACPLLVPLVEEGYFTHPAAELIVKEYLKPIKEHQIDTVLLGCTHYPLLKHLIQKEMDAEIEIIDSAVTCAQYVKSVLENTFLGAPIGSPTKFQYFVSDDPERFKAQGTKFLEMAIDHVSLTNHSLDLDIKSNQKTVPKF